MVRPDMDSNTASVMLSSTLEEKINGRQPAVPSTTQNRVTTRKPSRLLSSFCLPAVANQSPSPVINKTSRAVRKAPLAPSSYSREIRSGGTLPSRLKIISRMPRILTMMAACMGKYQDLTASGLEEAEADLEQSFHFRNFSAVNQEKNYMIV